MSVIGKYVLITYAIIFILTTIYILFIFPFRIGEIKMIVNSISSKYATTAGVYLGLSITGFMVLLDECIYGYFDIENDYYLPIGLFNCFILGIYFAIKLFKKIIKNIKPLELKYQLSKFY